MNIGKRIKLLRNELQLTQNEFADILGLSRNSVACYEGGTRNVGEYIVKNICRTFNVDYDWLTKGESEMFQKEPSETIDKLMEEYNIPENQLPLIKAYLHASPQTKEELLHFVLLVQKEKN